MKRKGVTKSKVSKKKAHLLALDQLTKLFRDYTLKRISLKKAVVAAEKITSRLKRGS